MHIYLGLLASVIGLGVSSHIYRKKRQKSKLFCPLRTQCDEVVHSTHSTFFGIQNEVLGTLYYVCTSTAFAIAYLFPQSIGGIPLIILIVAIAVGMLFSLYLISLQAFVLRAWCTWCLLSAFANMLLVISLFGFPLKTIIPFMQ